MKEYLKPGNYRITVTLSHDVDVEEGDHVTEADLKGYCREYGETVDWDIN